jgi:hypothetical protein
VEPIAFPCKNDVLCGCPGSGVKSLPIFRSAPDDPEGPYLISCWQLTQEEMEEVKRTGIVWLYTLGTTTPPVALSGKSPWPKGEGKEGS